MHADVVGYSAKVAADETATLESLKQGLALAEAIVTSHAGRIVNTAGDAFLAEFPSVVESLRAAIEFQNSNGPETGLEWRIGVNLGDIVIEGDDILGDGVNVAARVQELAPPGGIAITAAVLEQEGNRIGFQAYDLGLKRLKNVPTPVRVFLIRQHGSDTSSVTASRRFRAPAIAAALLTVVVLGVFIGWRSGTFSIPEFGRDAPETVQIVQKPVIAVLPFRDPTPGKEDHWFSDGLTEEVIRQLGRFPALVVLSWSAVEPFDEQVRLDDLRRELGADFVVSGTVWRSADKLRLSVDLSDTGNGSLVWSERYDTELADIFDVQDKVANAVAGSLAVGLSRDVERRAQRAPTESLNAYDLYLRGRVMMRKTEREANFEARKLFARAIALDPNFSDAQAGLAWTHVADAWWGWSEWPYESIELAIEQVNRAISLNGRNGLAHSILAEALWMQQDFDAALDESERALELNPNDSWALATHGSLLLHTGDPAAAIPLIEMAFRLNPHPHSRAFANLGLAYFLLDREGEAVDLLTRGIRVITEDPSPHAILAMAAHRAGKFQLAERAKALTLRLSPFFDPEIYAASFGGVEWRSEVEAGLRAAGFE
jgi:TolB-like protein/Flp pilus assembly protein TadD